jgi:hypothetical protein
VKLNFFGNDGGGGSGGGAALGVIPYIKIPTATGGLGNGRVEWGVILPVSVDLPGEFDLGAMVQLDVRRTDDNDRATADIIHSVTLGHEIAGGVGAYVEYAGLASVSHDREYRGYFDAGLTFKVTGDVQMDAGVRVGLTRGADDLALFAGMSVRF